MKRNNFDFMDAWIVLVTGGVVSAPTEQTLQQPTEMSFDIELPPEILAMPSEQNIELPPELTAQPPQPTTTIDQQRQAIFNADSFIVCSFIENNLIKMTSAIKC